MWAYARGAFEAEPGVVYDFYAGRGGKYPHALLKDWSSTLVVNAYSGYDATLSLDGRFTAKCLAHARRKFDELVKAGRRQLSWPPQFQLAVNPNCTKKSPPGDPGGLFCWTVRC